MATNRTKMQSKDVHALMALANALGENKDPVLMMGKGKTEAMKTLATAFLESAHFSGVEDKPAASTIGTIFLKFSMTDSSSCYKDMDAVEAAIMK